jgi:AhpD family alkylhydroperoxidase
MPESPWYVKLTPLGAAHAHFSNTAKRETVLDLKTKELIRLAVSSIFRCAHCTEHHVKDALSAGATKEEIAETLLLTALQSSGTQLNWHREFFERTFGTK